MPLHLIKLCVGVDSVFELEEWIAGRRRASLQRGEAARYAHVTRMMPKRAEELLAGGSLYWVVAGQLAARQRLLDIEPYTDGEGIGRCRLWLDTSELVRVLPRPFRAFQGWRYFAAKDAPPDLADAGEGLAAMPEAMRAELGALGLL